MIETERLTSLSHGGGCGCKISPSVLENILQEIPVSSDFRNLLVGAENRDDAAVYLLNEDQAIIATTDFFMPIVDDPEQFGRIAATNAISDIYAMGGTPILALSIMGMPVKKISTETIRKILHGGNAVCNLAGIPVAGGHSIDSEEPIYGLAVLGIVHPKNIKRNQGAKPGDNIILGKPIGIGILSHVLKNSSLSDSAYEKMIRYSTRLNSPGIRFGRMNSIHAMTDVTGFGLLGHLLEICRSSGVSAEINFSNIPFIPEAYEYAKEGNFTGASERNWSSYASNVNIFPGNEKWQISILCDPQTSGGLLLSADPSVTDEVLSIFHEMGFPEAGIIGTITESDIKSTVKVI